MMGRTYLWYAVEEAMFDGLSPRIHRLYLNRKRHVTAHELSLDVSKGGNDGAGFNSPLVT